MGVVVFMEDFLWLTLIIFWRIPFSFQHKITNLLFIIKNRQPLK